MKFEFRAYDEYDDGEYQEVTKTFYATTWDAALSSFQEFLSGCGYILDHGVFALVDKDELTASDIEDCRSPF